MDSLGRLGDGLRVLRERLGESQGAVAERAGITTAMLSRYERGVRKPHLDTLAAVLSALHVDLRALVAVLEEIQDPSAIPRGAARPEWSVQMAREAINDEALAAIAALDLAGANDRAKADFVMSFVTAAREVALSVVRDLESAVAEN